jgi:hypothetical protein
MTGQAEAVTVAPDNCTLYFHRKMGDRFRIMRTVKDKPC